MKKAIQQTIPVDIPLKQGTLHGLLNIPQKAKVLALFVHGSGSSYESPRNTQVASMLQDHGVGTLLFDLYTVQEKERGEEPDTMTLVDRVLSAVQWVRDHQSKELKIGLVGSSSGAGIALIAAYQEKEAIDVIACRGGRVDMAFDVLSQIEVPTLLVVGGSDSFVVSVNEEAFDKLSCEKDLKIVEGASHLFAEGDTLVQAADAISVWLCAH